VKTDFEVDATGAYRFAGYLDGMSTTVSTKRYLDSATQYSYRILAEQFGVAVDATARLAPKNFHHVYEWGDSWGDMSPVGNPAHRLWTLTNTGSGGKRIVGFTFLPSYKPTPVNPQLLEPGKSGQTVKEGIHVFTWKASVMEYGTVVTIRPQLGEWLALPGDEKPIFTKKTIRAVPGKGGTMGVFTGFFLKWWGGGAAQAAFNDLVRPKLESDLSDEAGLYSAMTKRRSSKTVRFNVADRAAFQEGQRAAQNKFEKNQGTYISRAADRRFDLYGE
jgi:hypothetical protein